MYLSLLTTTSSFFLSHAFYKSLYNTGTRQATSQHALVETAGIVGVGGFLAWAFQGVGPSEEAAASIVASPPQEIQELNGLLFGDDKPMVALYCGAKIRLESYAPLAQELEMRSKEASSCSSRNSTSTRSSLRP